MTDFEIRLMNNKENRGQIQGKQDLLEIDRNAKYHTGTQLYIITLKTDTDSHLVSLFIYLFIYFNKFNFHSSLQKILTSVHVKTHETLQYTSAT